MSKGAPFGQARLPQREKGIKKEKKKGNDKRENTSLK